MDEHKLAERFCRDIDRILHGEEAEMSAGFVKNCGSGCWICLQSAGQNMPRRLKATARNLTMRN